MKVFVCTLLLALLVAITASAADVTGNWSGTFTPESGNGGSGYLILKQTGTNITGSGGPDPNEQWPISNGKITGSKITGEVKDPNGVLYKLDLALEGDHIKGTIVMTSPDGQSQKAQLDVARVK